MPPPISTPTSTIHASSVDASPGASVGTSTDPHVDASAWDSQNRGFPNFSCHARKEVFHVFDILDAVTLFFPEREDRAKYKILSSFQGFTRRGVERIEVFINRKRLKTH
ncbi:hypothetical protein SUGI_0010300 [Cryptomeria japonica]|nr:hypothetical protein SUGI_0010300 [Cryptomeria japonica]